VGDATAYRKNKRAIALLATFFLGAIGAYQFIVSRHVDRTIGFLFVVFAVATLSAHIVVKITERSPN
jgi:hypothetical protein